MHKGNHQSPLAIAYAQALLELANEAKSTEATGNELRDIRQIVDTTPNVAQVLSDPSIGHEKRGKLIDTVFVNRASPLIVNFLRLLNVKGRMNILGAVAGAYDDLLDEQFGKVEVDVTVAQKLDNSELESVRKKVSASLKRDAVVHQYVDESIIGGLILRVRDQLIDGSMRTQLRQMQRNLIAAKPR